MSTSVVSLSGGSVSLSQQSGEQEATAAAPPRPPQATAEDAEEPPSLPPTPDNADLLGGDDAAADAASDAGSVVSFSSSASRAYEGDGGIIDAATVPLGVGETVPQQVPLLEDTNETVGASPTFAKFFRMLKMGVPRDAVKHKMEQAGVDPSVLDLGEDGSLVRAEAMQARFTQNQAARANSKPTSSAAGGTGAKSRRPQAFHWEAIPPERVLIAPNFKNAVVEPTDAAAGASATSVWAATSSTSLPTTILSPERASAAVMLFCVQPDFTMAATSPLSRKTSRSGSVSSRSSRGSIASGSRPATKKKAPQAKSVLDAKRAQALGICQKKLKLMPARLAFALKNMDESILTREVVEVLAAVGVWPASDEEKRAVLAARDSLPPDTTMHPSDNLVWMMATSVPDAAARVNALAFKYEFTTALGETREAARLAKVAAKELMASATLARVLCTFVAVGNAVNERSDHGATIASIVAASQVRARNERSVTFADFVVGVLSAHDESFDAKLLTELATTTSDAKRVCLSEVVKRVRDLRRGIETLRTVRQLEAFAFAGMRELDQAESELGVARDFFDRALAFLGYAKASVDSNVLFGDVDDLVRIVVAAATAARQKRERAAREAANAAEKKRREESTASRLARRARQSVVGQAPAQILASLKARASTKASGAPPAPTPPPESALTKAIREWSKDDVDVDVVVHHVDHPDEEQPVFLQPPAAAAAIVKPPRATLRQTIARGLQGLGGGVAKAS